MAHDHDDSDENWGNDAAHWTFLFTAILAALFLAAVLLFIL